MDKKVRSGSQPHKAKMNDEYDFPVYHFYLPIGSRGWEDMRLFLPFFRLQWAKDMSNKVCNVCPLAAHVHPMVQSPRNEYAYLKLCSASVIRNGLLSLKDVFVEQGGYNGDDDYRKAREMFGRENLPNKRRSYAKR